MRNTLLLTLSLVSTIQITLYCQTIRFATKQFTQNGITAAENIIIEASETFDGSGTLEGETITIKTKQFAFDGTINCSNTCIIESESPVDETSFSFRGTGTLTVAIKKYEEIDVVFDDFQKHPHIQQFPASHTCQN